ncbi:hypothetical protein [Nonomuraea sp. NPDC049607]
MAIAVGVLSRTGVTRVGSVLDLVADVHRVRQNRRRARRDPP